MSANQKKGGDGLRREAPPGVIAAAIVLVLCALGVGIYYVVNNGWQTESQKQYTFQHDFLPLENLHHGDRKMFDDENALRKKNGQPPLVDAPGPPKPSPEEQAKAKEVLLKAYAAKNGQGAPH